MKMNLRSFLVSLRNRHFLAADVLILAITPSLALLLRLDFSPDFELYASSLIIYTWIFLVVKPILFWRTKLYSPFWAYASIDALKALVRAALISSVVELTCFFGLLYPFDLLPVELPRSLPLINAVLTMLFVGSTRFSVRMLFDISTQKQGGVPLKPALIAGAGVAGSMVVKELRMNPQVGLKPVAFLDDDTHLHGRRIHGVMVVGRLASVAEAAKRYGTEMVIIAMPTAPGRVVRDLVQACQAAGIASRTVPGLFEIASGQARVSELREIQIEDLLRRGVIKTDHEGVAHILQGKRVMVTGAGGSIGSELCRQIALNNPGQLILLGHGENSIFKIANELKKHLTALNVSAVIGDIRDKKRMRMVFRTCRPEVIFHAAAHKHVGLMQVNVPEAVTNNVLGTRNLVELAAEHDVERFVMISSDKAVNPTSIMGVTKRIAELVVNDAAATTGKPFVSVRFGNVLGSRGSVVPIFNAQIAAGGPVTVSDPRVTRFFMTIPEAVQLVLQAGAMGDGGEVFVLDMGEPIKVLDLARDVIRLNGLTEGRDIDIVFTGLKPGEKLHEELFLSTERPERSRHPKIFVCANGYRSTLSSLHAGPNFSGISGLPAGDGNPQLRQTVQELIEAAQLKSVESVEELIRSIVPEYQGPFHASPVLAAPDEAKSVR